MKRGSEILESVRTKIDSLVGRNDHEWVSAVLQNWNSLRYLYAILSIATLHAVGFCLNISPSLWPFIDISFLASITFSFFLVLALAVFLVRGVPQVFMALALLARMTAALIKNSSFDLLRRDRCGVMRQKMAEFESFPFPRQFKKNILPIFLVLGLPTPAGIRKIRVEQEIFVERYQGAANILSYLCAVFVVCYFYTGWLLLLWAIPFIYAMAIVTIAAWPTAENDLIIAAGGAKNDKRSLIERGASFAGLLSVESREKILKIVFLAVGTLSLLTGYARFGYLERLDPVEIKLGASVIRGQIIVSTGAAVLTSHSGKEQMIIPNDSPDYYCIRGGEGWLSFDRAGTTPCIFPSIEGNS